MAFTNLKMEGADIAGRGVMGLPDSPNLSTSDMQHKFDELSKDLIIPRFNALVDGINGATAASNIGARPTTSGHSVGDNIQTVLDTLDDSFTTQLSNVNRSLTNAEFDIDNLEIITGIHTQQISEIERNDEVFSSEIDIIKPALNSALFNISQLEQSTTQQFSEIRESIPTNTSELINDSNFVEDANYEHIDEAKISSWGFAKSGGSGSYSEGDGIKIEDGVISVDDTIMRKEDVSYSDDAIEINIKEKILKSYNLIPYPYADGTSKTIEGITFTANEDGSVTANGTATSQSTYSMVASENLWRPFIKGHRYAISGGKSANQRIRVEAEGSSGFLNLGQSSGEGSELSHIDDVVDNYYDVKVYIDISSGEVLDNVVFKPMLVEASSDGTYPTKYQRYSVGIKNLIANKYEEWEPGRFPSYRKGEVCASDGKLWESIKNNNDQPLDDPFAWEETNIVNRLNYINNLEVPPVSQINPSVKNLNLKSRGYSVSCIVNFTPSSNGLILVKGIPTSEMVNRCYFPVFDFNNGKPINGGVWFADGTITYYGDTTTSECVCLIQYNI